MKLDQNFTDPDEARKLVRSLIERIDPACARHYIEPSCGGGAFVDALLAVGVPRHRIRTVDIDPKLPADIHGDFLTTPLGINWNPATTVVIGNPPFGSGGQLARAFINKATEYANWICFVVPRGMHGARSCSTLNPRLDLVYEKQLPRNFVGTDAKCQWQEWFLLADGCGRRPTEIAFDTQGLYELVSAKDASDIVIQRVGGNAGSVVSGAGAACNKYFIRSPYPEVIRAFRNLGKHPEADLTTNQKSLSTRMLHELFKEQFIKQYTTEIKTSQINTEEKGTECHASI
jgi:predicted RNA methylase